jgi:hypothetical protein
VVPTQPTGPQGGVQFDPTPQYYVAFGSYQPGDVVSISTLLYPTLVQFPLNTTNADCAFDGLRWTITYS